MIAGDIVKVKKLIDMDVDIDARDYFGRTPLLLACQKGYENIVKLLVESNAEIDAKDNYGKNCLHFVVHDGRYYSHASAALIVYQHLHLMVNIFQSKQGIMVYSTI